MLELEGSESLCNLDKVVHVQQPKLLIEILYILVEFKAGPHSRGHSSP